MTQPEIERFCEGTLRAAVLAQRIYRERFLYAWTKFDAKIGKGEIK